MASRLPNSSLRLWESRLSTSNLNSAKTPEHIIKKLNAAVVKVLAQPDVKERIAATGSEAKATSSAEFKSEIKTTFERTKKIVEARGIKPEGS